MTSTIPTGAPAAVLPTWETCEWGWVYVLDGERLGFVEHRPGYERPYAWGNSTGGSEGSCGSLRSAKRHVEQTATEGARKHNRRMWAGRVGREGKTTTNYRAVPGQPLDVPALRQLLRELADEGIEWSPVDTQDHGWSVPRRYAIAFTCACGGCLLAAEGAIPRGAHVGDWMKRRARLEKLARRCTMAAREMKARIKTLGLI